MSMQSLEEKEHGNGKMEGQIHISGDYSSAESSNFYSDNSIVDDSDIGSQLIYDSKNPSDGVDDATKHISVQEDLQDVSAFDNKLVFASESPVPLESENTIDSFNALLENHPNLFSPPLPIILINLLVKFKTTRFQVYPYICSHR